MNVNMTLQQFDDLYDEASRRHPRGDVSVESFRNVLDEIRANELKETEGKLMSTLVL